MARAERALRRRAARLTNGWGGEPAMMRLGKVVIPAVGSPDGCPALGATDRTGPSRVTEAGMIPPGNGLNRRVLLGALAALPVLDGLLGTAAAQAQATPLASWNDGPAKQAVLDFVRRVTTPGGPDFVPPE